VHRYFIQLAYHGQRFHGWQSQPNAPSIQECIETQLKVLFKEHIAITGCGRTDTGVHASLFYAHFDVEQAIENPDKLCNSLNSLLPSGIAIHQIFEVGSECHTRFDATLRTYHYHIHFQKNPFISATSSLLFQKPDFELMNQACKHLIGTQDFSAFNKSHASNKTGICELTKAEWTFSDHKAVFTISANRFLRNMVRAIVGTLLEVGYRKISPEDFKQIILSLDRKKAGTSVPAHGLFLADIQYPYLLNHQYVGKHQHQKEV
jgi:tRNA pseudouridine38-40 synthase